KYCRSGISRSMNDGCGLPAARDLSDDVKAASANPNGIVRREKRTLKSYFAFVNTNSNGIPNASPDMWVANSKLGQKPPSSSVATMRQFDCSRRPLHYDRSSPRPTWRITFGIHDIAGQQIHSVYRARDPRECCWGFELASSPCENENHPHCCALREECSPEE